ncbi:MAG: tetratricopeptide repeat protein [Bryobacteraceae bacterium]|nr:tetratricopeptide repeat protein [Bryobacteraceae bacterium]
MPEHLYSTQRRLQCSNPAPPTTHKFLPSLLLIVFLTLSFACAKNPQQEAAAFLARGKRLMQDKDYARAALEFQNVLRLAPKDIEANFQLGLISLDTGRPREAYLQFQKVVELDPRNAAAHLKLAELMLAPHDRDLAVKAEEHVQNVLALNPTDNDALFFLARTRFEMGKPEEAIKYLREVHARAPKHLNSALALAQVAVQSGDRAAAEEILKKMLEQQPVPAGAHAALGVFYVSTQRDGAAEAQFRNELKADPKHEQSLLQLAALLERTGHADEAGEYYRRLSALGRPEYKPAYGIYLARHKTADEAIAEFRRLFEDAPNDRQARDRLVTVYVAARRAPEALKLLEAALARNPRDVTALVGRASILLTKGSREDARRDVDQALQLEPTSAAGHYVRARVQRAGGEMAAQRSELEEALRLEPTFLAARLELADLYLQSRQPDAAAATLSGATAEQKKTLAFAVIENWTLIRKGNLEAARKSVAGAMARFGGNPEFVLQDGVVRLAGRDYDGARASLEKVLEASPNDSRALRALARSYEAQNRNREALEAVRRHATGHGSALAAQMVYATTLLRGGERAEARKVLTHLKTVRPEDVTAELILSKLDVEDGKAADASQRLEAVVKAEPRNAQAILMLAMVDESLNRADRAVSNYRTAAALEPRNVVALNNLAGALARDPARLDEALGVAQKAKELAPDDSFVADTLGWIYYRKRLYTRAVRELESALKQGPRPTVQYHLGLAYLKTGDSRRGADLLAAAMKANPHLAKTEGTP